MNYKNIIDYKQKPLKCILVDTTQTRATKPDQGSCEIAYSLLTPPIHHHLLPGYWHLESWTPLEEIPKNGSPIPPRLPSLSSQRTSQPQHQHRCPLPWTAPTGIPHATATRHHCRILGPSPWRRALPYMISIQDRWHHAPPGDPPSRPRPWRCRPTIHRAGLCLSASSIVGRWRKGTAGVATARVSLPPPRSRRGTISFLSTLQRNEVCYFSYLLFWHHRYWFIVVSSQFTAWPNSCSALKCVTYFGKM
jgi:hypothetical protein